MPYCYDYPRPMVTVDAVVFRTDLERQDVELLLIERSAEPFRGCWALPGGFMEMDETLKSAAERELSEETGLSNVSLFFLEMADRPDRDPRGRTLSAVFAALVQPGQKTQAGSDARKCGWFSLKNLPPTAFDHGEIIRRTVEEVRTRLVTEGRILSLLPEKFSVAQIRRVLELWRINGALALQLIEKLTAAGWVKRDSGGLYKQVGESAFTEMPTSGRLNLFWGSR